MKKIFVYLFFILLFVCPQLTAQKIVVTCPNAINKGVKIFFFEGSKVDSLQSSIDLRGEAQFSLPQTNYRGLAALFIEDQGGIEFVVAEPFVEVVCTEAQLNNETVSFPNSKENTFLKYIFNTSAENSQKKAWLQAGAQYYPPMYPLMQKVQHEQQEVEQSISKLQKELGESSLYAATYFKLVDFVNYMYAVEQRPDKQQSTVIQKEIETNLDIMSLYTSGNLWSIIPRQFINIYSKVPVINKQKEYAAYVHRTLKRLPHPYYGAFLEVNLIEVNRMGWIEAKDSIMSQALTDNPNVQMPSEWMQRSLAAYRVKNKCQAPQIQGLAPTKKKYDGGTLLFFYGSGCYTCIEESIDLVKKYPSIKKQGIRVVSIASDESVENFERENKKFPWDDKLCDFKGYGGVNFVNFGIEKTPTYILIGQNGKVVGKYDMVSELDFLK